MANGRVITGFSKPYVALYSANGTTITYSSGQILARGVSVSLEVENGDASYFYADNTTAETIGGLFTGATATLEIDGLLDAARSLIAGLPAPTSETVGSETVQIYDYDDSQAIPYVGIGFVVRYMSGGVTSYVPVIFTKAQFEMEGMEATTQGEEIEFQTTELNATVMRDDSANHTWRRIGEGQATEAAAEAVIKKLFSIT